ncbi:glycosyltransferase [Kibdelosporangium aridum]|uniref:glycosyltransferase n=1 Tax=Kibdelosporangium aridum TaxID=2030 RepID=UPI000524FBCC
MKVLISTVPTLGHIYPLLPLARAFRARGNPVAFVGPASVGSSLSAEDVEVLTAGVEYSVVLEERQRRTGAIPYTPTTFPVRAETFAGILPDLSTEDVLNVVRPWQPDVILSDSYDFVGALVAAALGIPSGTVTLGQDMHPELQALMRDTVTSRYQARSVSSHPPIVVADICPPSLQAEYWQKPEQWTLLRPEAHRAPGGTSPAPGRANGRPRVLLTFGTLFGDPARLAPIIGKLQSLDIDLSVTLGRQATPEDFDVDRDGVTFEPFRPLAELLDGVDLMVSHGGAGTTLGALASGIPMVLLPQGADQFIVSERAAAAGAAVRLLPDDADDAAADAIRQAVNTVLAKPAFRDSAVKIAAEIASMPSPDAVAADISEARIRR